MATQAQKRRPALLAILLALLAAGALCIWAIAAAGFTISSPLIDSIAAFFGGGDGATSPGGVGGQVAEPGGGGGGAGADDAGGAGDDDGGGGGGKGGGGGQNDCLLGFLCVSAGAGAGGDADTGNGQRGIKAAADTDNGNTDIDLDADVAGTAADNQSLLKVGVSASADDENTTCFLGLICFTAMADVATASQLAGSLLHVDADADEDGVGAGANLDSNSDGTADADADAQLDANTEKDSGKNCFLGLICLDVNLNGSSSIEAGAGQAGFFEILWQAFVSLFVGAEVS